MLPATTGQGEGPPKDNISFVKEIQLMMFGLGDSPTPLATTAHVVENVVLQQMRSFLELLEEVANKRGSETISENDILFLLRKDKHKLKRLLTYISIKELRVGLKSTAINPALIHSTLSDVIVPTATILETKYKKSRIDFLKSIGVNNVDDNNEIDTVKSERDARSYQTVTKISEGAYAAYTTSRQTSFSGGNISSSRFLEWLKTRYLDFPMNKIKPTAVDMLVYLAKETVAQLIDLALLVRQDSNVIPGDPFSRAQQAGCFPYETFGPAQRQIEGSPPIHPNEIREVLRRYWSTQSSPWGAFIVDINCNTYQRLLTVYKM